MSDFYASQDLLADVNAAATADAPEPVPVRDCDGSLIKLYASRHVHSIQPRPETAKIAKVTPGPRQGHAEGPRNGSGALTAPARADQGEA